MNENDPYMLCIHIHPEFKYHSIYCNIFNYISSRIKTMTVNYNYVIVKNL
jgi:hypothetical protein